MCMSFCVQHVHSMQQVSTVPQKGVRGLYLSTNTSDKTHQLWNQHFNTEMTHKEPKM